MSSEMKTRKKMIEVEEQYWELTREELLSLLNLLRGGNAMQNNVQLINYVADVLILGNPTPCTKLGATNRDDLASALRERATMLDNGIRRIENLIWPPK
jgi:hypothetical protein